MNGGPRPAYSAKYRPNGKFVSNHTSQGWSAEPWHGKQHGGKSDDWVKDEEWHGSGERWSYGKYEGGSSSSSSYKKQAPYAKKDKQKSGGADEKQHRGGWFSKCQLVCREVLAHNWGLAKDLAEEFYAGPEQF